MIVKVLFIAILAYLVLRSARNLLQAVQQDTSRPDAFPRSGPTKAADQPARPGAAASRRRPDDDVEDAKWVDLEP